MQKSRNKKLEREKSRELVRHCDFKVLGTVYERALSVIIYIIGSEPCDPLFLWDIFDNFLLKQWIGPITKIWAAAAPYIAL